jgi:hypothetical protein
MNFIHGVTFLLENGNSQSFAGEETRRSLVLMKETTGCDTVILAFGALQDTPYSEGIDWQGPIFPTDQDLIDLITYAKSLGLRVILKPMLNCRNGVWRAHIAFFDKDVPCEPKGSVWFQHYSEYILHAAALAEKTSCEMLLVGCELVQMEHWDAAWRELVKKVRGIYHGLVSYNTDKYQEEMVTWWDCLDVISSSGYYPESAWNKNLDRIEAVVKRYNRPFFFAECGCMCRIGCEEVPNDWRFEGPFDPMVQAKYYEVMFRECAKRPWIRGFGIWDWPQYQIQLKNPAEDDGYFIWQKPAAAVIRAFYES